MFEEVISTLPHSLIPLLIPRQGLVTSTTRVSQAIGGFHLATATATAIPTTFESHISGLGS